MSNKIENTNKFEKMEKVEKQGGRKSGSNSIFVTSKLRPTTFINNSTKNKDFETTKPKRPKRQVDKVIGVALNSMK